MTGFMLYPAIDVRDGPVVRLRQGDYAQETRYADEPLEVVARVVERPRDPADLDLLEPLDHLVHPRGDLRMLVAEFLHAQGQPRGALEDLVVETVGLLGDLLMLLERPPYLDDLLEDPPDDMMGPGRIDAFVVRAM